MGRMISSEALRRFPLFAGVEGELLRKLAADIRGHVVRDLRAAAR